MTARIPLPPSAVPAVPLPPPAAQTRSKADWVRQYFAAGWRAFAVVPNGKTPMRAGWQQATEAGALAEFAASPGANIGATPPPGCFVLDVDGEIGAATLAAFEIEHGALPDTLEARTQSGGRHLALGLPPGVTLPNAVRWAEGLDVRMSGRGYIVVEPSTINGRVYHWVNWGAPIAQAPGWLIAAVANGKAADKPKVEGSTGGACGSLIPEGMRNSTLAGMAGAMRKAGFSQDAIRTALEQANEERCDPPLQLEEVAIISASMSKYAPALEPWQVFGQGVDALPAGASEEFGIIIGPDDGAMDVFAPLPHYVDKWIPQDEVTLLAGHGGGGKSYVALSLAACVALGRPFGPLATRRANVLFYSAEDGARVLRSRRAKVCRSMGIDPAALEGKLILLDASDIDPALFRRGELPALASLATLVAKHKAELVVIDNASDAFDGEEIKRAEVRGFIRALRARLARPGRAVLLLAHINKQNATSGRSAGAEDYSGSTAWHNSVRSRLSLNPSGSDAMTLEHMKANHGPKADPVRMAWRDGVPVVVEVAPVDHAAEADRREEQKRALVGLIQKIEGRGARVFTARTGGYSTFNTLSAEAGYPKEIDKELLSHLMNELQDDGLLFRKWIKSPDRKSQEIFSCSP